MKVLCFSILATCALVVSVYAADWCLTPDCCSLLPTGTILGNPNNFTRYYRCIGGNRYGYECLSALRPCFNNVTSSCDARENVPYCGSEGSTTTAETPGAQCRDGEIHFVPVAGNCNAYRVCDNGLLLPGELLCGAGQQFDSGLEQCSPEGQVQCTPPVCDPTRNYSVPHTMVCSRYWTCTMGTLESTQCAAGENFDVIDLLCKPVVDATCTPGCPDDGTAFLAHDDCTKYWLCTNGTPNLRECGTGLFFNCTPTVLRCTAEVDDIACGCIKPPPRGY